MTPEQARQILLLHRPGISDSLDPDLSRALALMKEDAALRDWYREHVALQQAIRAKFQSLQPPPDLEARLLAIPKVIRPAVWWRRPIVVAAAAAAVVLLFVGVGKWWSAPTNPPDQFTNFRERMVRTALREYRMDVVTNDLVQVRRFMAERGAPSDYAVPAGLQALSLTGGGLIKWRGNPVSMVCFDRGDREMAFLFVVKRSAFKDAPPPSPQPLDVNRLHTRSWTQGDFTYVLASIDADLVSRQVP